MPMLKLITNKTINRTFDGNSKTTQNPNISSNTLDKRHQPDSTEFSNNKDISKGIIASVATIFIAGIVLFCTKGKRGKIITNKIHKGLNTNKSSEKDVMTMTEDAKIAYNETLKKLTKKTKINTETIENNLKPKASPGSWSTKDMKDYYIELESKPVTTVLENGSIETVSNKRFTHTLKNGKKLDLTLNKREVIDEYIKGEKRKQLLYNFLDSNGKRLLSWDAQIVVQDGEKVLVGHGIISFKPGIGLGKKMKEIIKQTAIENGCKSINIDAAYQSHMFHNKMGYKVNCNNFQDIRRLFYSIRNKKALPEFDMLIKKIEQTQNLKAGNRLMDAILSAANAKKLRSADIGIDGSCIPMTYTL